MKEVVHILTFDQKKNRRHTTFSTQAKKRIETNQGIQKMSYFDEEIEKDFVDFGINYEKLDDATHDKLVTKINKNIPFTGSKIAWRSFPDSTSYSKNNVDTAFIDILNKVNNLGVKEIIFIGDSRTESAYKIHTINLEKYLTIFADIPQHTYFFSNEFNFIGCISSEGEINFSEIHL